MIIPRAIEPGPTLAQIVNLDKLDYCSTLRNLDEVKDCPNYKFIKGNIMSPDLVTYVLQTENIDTIIHAAAQTHVDNSFGNSFTFTENNVLGTHVLLESAKSCGIKRFMHVSTDEVRAPSSPSVSGPSLPRGACRSTARPTPTSRAGRRATCSSRPTRTPRPRPRRRRSRDRTGSRSSCRCVPRAARVDGRAAPPLCRRSQVIVTRGNNVFGPHQYPEKVAPPAPLPPPRPSACVCARHARLEIIRR